MYIYLLFLNQHAIDNQGSYYNRNLQTKDQEDFPLFHKDRGHLLRISILQLHLCMDRHSRQRMLGSCACLLPDNRYLYLWKEIKTNRRNRNINFLPPKDITELSTSIDWDTSWKFKLVICIYFVPFFSLLSFGSYITFWSWAFSPEIKGNYK